MTNLIYNYTNPVKLIQLLFPFHREGKWGIERLRRKTLTGGSEEFGRNTQRKTVTPELSLYRDSKVKISSSYSTFRKDRVWQQWSSIFKKVRGKLYGTGTLYPAKLSFKSQSHIKTMLCFEEHWRTVISSFWGIQ